MAFQRPLLIRGLLASIGFYAIALPVSGAGAPSTTADVPHEVPSLSALITRLGDPDPAVRSRATAAIREIGTPARKSLMEAAKREDDPQIAEEAGQLLRSLPWGADSDSEGVRSLLKNYGDASVADRIGIVVQIAPQAMGQITLLRLLDEEPNQDVCWQIEKLLRTAPSLATINAAREFSLTTARPSQLVLAAHAWLEPLGASPPTQSDLILEAIARSVRLLVAKLPIDRDRAMALLAKAVELETAHPTYDNGEMDFAFDQLAIAALQRNEPQRAADLRRMQVPRIGVTRDTYAAPFFDLLVLHAKFGPIAGLDADLQLGEPYLSEPEALFSIGKIYAQAGRRLQSETAYQLAINAGLFADTRFRAAAFLAEHGWDELAARECLETLARGRSVPDRADINAHLMLSALAVRRGDEADAAKTLREGVEASRSMNGDAAARGEQAPQLQVTRAGRVIVGDEAEHIIEIDIAQHALHAAQEKKDSEGVDRQLDELLRLGASDADAAIDVVPELKKRGRTAEAAKLFASAYAPLKARIDSGESDLVLWNDTAWLCARCDEQLPEAVALSNRAVAARPGTSAFLDTCAEAHYRIGEHAEAVRLETLALKCKPGDRFMREQLERFKAGKPE